MVKVKTFTNELKIFHVMNELDQLDQQVNQFISAQSIKKVISVSDSCTTNSSGATMGIIRALTYEEDE
jgi:hypothetical protein